ncbi:MAG TPA: riboflavin synthase [Ohtaekwangia sp.]|nr:riboflavin synthase [Ohtaekwangia sp.]
MFTGIIEAMGIITDVSVERSNKRFTIESPLSDELKIDQSVSHNGVCLTVVDLTTNSHTVVAVDETLTKSNLGALRAGDKINLERCMLSNGRFDGHIVQGHVDQVGRVKFIREAGGSWLFTFEYDPSKGNVTVEKGSIAVNGVSLTCFNSTADNFTIAIIPYTFEHTNFHLLKIGDTVNLEFDIIGKYVKRLLQQ